MHKTLIVIISVVLGVYVYKNNTFPTITKYIDDMLNLPNTVASKVDDLKKVSDKK